MKREAKTVSAATRSMLDKLREEAGAAPASEDKLERVHTLVAELRDAELTKAAQEEALKQTNIVINDLLWSKLPQVMDEAQMLDCTIKADGNKPPYTVKVEDDYKANIPDDSAGKAFAYLKKRGDGDLIKHTYTISFGLGEDKAAERFERSLEKAGIAFSKKSGVPWNTLTAWFREEHKKKPLPKKVMDMLGASIRRVAKVVKQKKEKK